MKEFVINCNISVSTSEEISQKERAEAIKNVVKELVETQLRKFDAELTDYGEDMTIGSDNKDLTFVISTNDRGNESDICAAVEGFYTSSVQEIEFEDEVTTFPYKEYGVTPEYESEVRTIETEVTFYDADCEEILEEGKKKKLGYFVKYNAGNVEANNQAMSPAENGGPSLNPTGPMAEEKKQICESDGWDTDNGIIANFLDKYAVLDKYVYEIRMGRRGVFTDADTYAELKDRIEEALEEIEDSVEDFDTIEETQVLEEETNMEKIYKKFPELKED